MLFILKRFSTDIFFSGKSLSHILRTIVKHGVTVKELRARSSAGLGEEYSTFKPEWVQGFGSLALMAVCVLFAMILLTSLVKNIKNRDFFERSIVGKVSMGIYNLFVSKDITMKRLYFLIVVIFASCIYLVRMDIRCDDFNYHTRSEILP